MSLDVNQDEAADMIRAIGDETRPEGLTELTGWFALHAVNADPSDH